MKLKAILKSACGKESGSYKEKRRKGNMRGFEKKVVSRGDITQNDSMEEIPPFSQLC